MIDVGAVIEEIDMIDINKALLSIDNQDIVLVYQNLLKGSRNHLRSLPGDCQYASRPGLTCSGWRLVW